MFAPCELPLSMDPQVESRPHDRRWISTEQRPSANDALELML